jgi:hypothetical protein
MFVRYIFLVFITVLGLCATSNVAIAQASGDSTSAPQITDCQGYASYVGQYENLTTYSDSDANQYLKGYFHIDLSKTNDQTINGLIDQVQACIKTFRQEQYSIPGVNVSSDQAQKAQQLDESIAALQGVGTDLLQSVYDLTDASNVAQQTQKNAALIATIPQCGDSTVIANLKNDVANSPQGKNEGLALLGVKNFVDGTDPSGMTFRACEADALFNDGEYPLVYRISWFDQSQGQLSITMQLPQ